MRVLPQTQSDWSEPRPGLDLCPRPLTPQNDANKSTMDNNPSRNFFISAILPLEARLSSRPLDICGRAGFEQASFFSANKYASNVPNSGGWGQGQAGLPTPETTRRGLPPSAPASWRCKDVNFLTGLRAARGS